MLNFKLHCSLGAAALLLAAPALAGVTFYEHQDFHGRAFTAEHRVKNLARVGFNDRASSVVVDRGNWEVCDDAGYRGHCVVLQPGSYDSLRGMGLNDRVSSARRERGHAGEAVMTPPMPAPDYAWRRRPNERLFEAPVSSVHAVMGPPQQRCWVDREAVQQQDEPNVGRGLIGAVIGGVIGHQIGGGTGQDLATVGGAVAGAVIGARSGPHGDGGMVQRDVRRCRDVAQQGPPAYWDVAYVFRGVEHHVQMTQPPGRSVTVNRQGDPRG